MPGSIYGQFVNPLRTGGGPDPRSPGLPVIDITTDIVELEFLSTLPLNDPSGGPTRPPEVPANVFRDLEAIALRIAINERADPAYSVGGGGDGPFLWDLTWAFNQATGARPDVGDLVEPGVDQSVQASRVDPESGKTIYSMNPQLPSLNRQPGIIFVPRGIFHIFGTVTLFSGQQLVGVGNLGSRNPAAPGQGSVLVKVGDGACIRTQGQLDVASDLFRSPESIVGTFIEGANQVQSKLRSVIDELTVQLQHFVDTSADRDAAQRAATRRLEQLTRMLEQSIRPYPVEVRVSSVYIRQQNIPQATAQPPVEDAMANITVPVATLSGEAAVRDVPIPYSSVGIDLVRTGSSVVEDVTIRGFDRGVGIQIHAQSPGGANGSYCEIRRVDVGGCHRGILAQPVFGALFVNGARPEALFFADIANSFVLADCHVHGYGRAGVEMWGDTMWMILCEVSRASADPEFPTVIDPDPVDGTAIGPCVIVAGNANNAYRCSFSVRSDGAHVVMAPAPKFEQFTVTAGDAEPAGDDSNPVYHDILRVRRVPFGDPRASEIAAANGVFHCDFSDLDGNEMRPAVHVLEFAADPVAPAAGVAQDALKAIQRPAWDHSGSGQVAAPIIELTGEALSPESFWTSDNLLQNVGFAPAPPRSGDGPAEPPSPGLPRGWRQAPAGWSWVLQPNTLPPNDAGPEVHPNDADPPDAVPTFAGPVLLVDFAGGERGAACLEFPLVPALPDGGGDPVDPAVMSGYRGAWAKRARFQGKRLVGSCWVRANYVGAVDLRFRGDGEDYGFARAARFTTNWRPNVWQQLSAFHDSRRHAYAELSSREDFEIAFCIVFHPPDEGSMPANGETPRIMIGGPAAHLGPELFPVGPPRIAVTGGTLSGPRSLRYGPASTLTITHFRPAVSAAAVGFDVRVEGVEVHADPATASMGRYRLAIERDGEARTLAEARLVELADAGFMAALRDVELRRGDVVTLTRLDGPEAPVEVLLRLRGSRTI